MKTRRAFLAALIVVALLAILWFLLPRGSQKVDAPFDTAMYIRGMSGKW